MNRSNGRNSHNHKKRSFPGDTHAENGFPSKKAKTNQQERSFLHEELKTLFTSTAKAFEDADTEQIKQSYSTFKKLSYSEEEWQQAVKDISKWIVKPYSSNLLKAPEQKDPKDIIGGHLFYSPYTHQLLASSYTEHLLERRDYILGFLYATKFKNPAAEYYLAFTLAGMFERHHESYLDEIKGYPTFFEVHIKHALKELEKCNHHPDACFILGINYSIYPSRCGIETDSDRKALDMFKKGQDARNKLATLELKNRSKLTFKEDERPSIQDFVALGEREHYGPALVKASEIEKDNTKKEEYLNKAIQYGFYPAYIDFGFYLKNKANKATAFECFKKAGEKGISYGYILYATLLVNKFEPFPCTPSVKEIKEVLAKDKKENTNTLKDIDHYLKLAGQMHDPKG